MKERTSFDKSMKRMGYKFSPHQSFILDVVRERALKQMTQEELANAMGTTQPVISRFENLGRKPSFEFMERITKALGGELFVTTQGQYAFVVPAAYREAVDRASAADGVSPKEYLEDLLVSFIGSDESIRLTYGADYGHWKARDVEWQMMPAG